MKLLLTSAGLSSKEITDCFLELLCKPVCDAKIFFVTAAANTDEEFEYVDISKKELLDLGIAEENIYVTSLDNPADYDDIKKYDVIYVCGGNTFYLLKKIREAGFDRAVKRFVREGGVYFGVSAGSILACPDIGIASFLDNNDVIIKDMGGLNLVNFIVFPHYSEKLRKIIDDFEKKIKTPVFTITDSQAILANENCTKIIG